MSFADEVTASKTQKSAPPPQAAEAAPTPAAEMTPKGELPTAAKEKVAFSVEDMDFNQTASKETVLPVGKPDAAPEAPAAEAKVPVIRVGGMEFKSVEDAIKYADELSIARQQEEAYLQGFQKAKAESEPAPPPEPDVDERIEQLLFENPKAAIKELREQAKKEIFAEYDKMMATQTKERAQQESSQKMWGDFYEKNTDLSDPDTRDFVQNHLLQKHWERLQNVPTEKALAELADLARKALRITKENALPTRELHSGPAVVPGSSGNSTGSPIPVTDQKDLDFVSQVNRLRRRNTN